MVVVKNASNSKIQRYFTVDTFGSCTLKEALQSKSELDIPLSSLGLESDDFYRNWAERKASEFKGQQLNLIYNDGVSNYLNLKLDISGGGDIRLFLNCFPCCFSKL